MAGTLLTVKQAAVMTSYSEAYFRKLIWQRRIETVRFGNRTLRIPLVAINAMIAAGTVPANETAQ